MENTVKKQKAIFVVLCLCLCVVGFLSACSTKAILEDAFIELEAITNDNGDIEFDVSIRLFERRTTSELQDAVLSTQQSNTYNLKNFEATTPKGNNLEGILAVPKGFSDVGTNLINAKLRGKVSTISGEKLFSGFVIANGGGLGLVPMLAYRKGASFEAASANGTSFKSSAELIKRDDGLIAMVTRSQAGILISLISEDLGLKTTRSKQQIELELTTRIDGILSRGTANITLPGSIKFVSSVIGVFVHISA